MDSIKCPACGAANPVEATICEQCNADLNPVKSLIDTANRHYNEALALAHDGKLDEAIGQLEAAIALSANRVEYFNLLGTVYAQKGLFSEAIRQFEKGIAINPQVEKVYQNIDKARYMEETRAEEIEERPQRQMALIASIVAIFFFLSTLVLSAQYFLKSRTISNLSKDVELFQNEANSWKSQFEVLNRKFPAEDMDGILKQMVKSETLIEEKERRISILDQRLQSVAENNNAKIMQLQNQIKTLQNEKNVLDSNLKQIDKLRDLLEESEKQVETNKQTITLLQEELKKANERSNTHKNNLLTAQDNMRDIRDSRERTIQNLSTTHEDQLKEMRNQVIEIRDDIAKQERILQDRKYSDSMVVESLQNLVTGNFDLALQTVSLAIERTHDHPTALYLQKEINRILDDPVEKEVRLQEIEYRESKREVLTVELIDRNLEEAEKSYKNGDFLRTIELAQRAIELKPADTKKVEELKRLEHKAQEESQQIAMLMLEVTKSIENQEIKKAESTLKQILKRAPNHEKARYILDQIVQ
jgi:tetratricopeptide (TPR) repeat protein